MKYGRRRKTKMELRHREIPLELLFQRTHADPTLDQLVSAEPIEPTTTQTKPGKGKRKRG